MKMQATSNSSLAVASYHTTVTSPVIGEDYVLVKRSEMKKEEKDSEGKTVVPKNALTARMSTANGRASVMGTIRAKITYDSVITPQTNAALATYLAISAYSDAQSSSYWKYLFKQYTIKSAFIELDFHEYMNMIGTADKFSVLGWSYRTLPSSAVPGYTSISDDSTFKQVKWSEANPVVRYNISKKMLKDVNFCNAADMAVGDGLGFNKWCPFTQNYCMGFLHIASYDTFNAGTSGRRIFCRLVLDVEMTNRI